EQAALTLQRAPASVERSAPFSGMGFDSLRAAELHQRLLKLTGLSLSISMLWNYPTIDEFAAALWDQLNTKSNEQPESATEPVRAAPATSIDELLSEIMGLPDSEVDASFETK